MMRHDLVFTNEIDGKLFRRIIWVTDLHLDALGPEAYKYFFDLVRAHEPHIILVGGDISNGQKSLTILARLRDFLKKPIYYVLGNHDYYYGSIQAIRHLATEQQAEGLTYLTSENVIELTPNTALIGHDGWADGREGHFLKSDVMLNDYVLINELKQITPEERLKRLNALGDEAANNIKPRLEQALSTYDHVIFLTHPPPFRESCQYNGHITDDNWAPHFVCQAVGKALHSVMEKHPEKQLLVLAGHSHQATDTKILPNLHVLVGDSTLGQPIVQGIVHIA